MNDQMWAHPITAKQIRLLEEEWGVNGVNPDEGWIEVLRPQIKTLAMVKVECVIGKKSLL
jgi:phosphopantothenoylcysteine decarboxylase